MLCTAVGHGQNQKNILDSLHAVNLNRKAIPLVQNGLLTQALDSFNVSLNLRKKLLGS